MVTWEDLTEEQLRDARRWANHMHEITHGVPLDAPPGTPPRPRYDPDATSMTQREKAKVAELEEKGVRVTLSAISKRRRRYQRGGLAAMVDGRLLRKSSPYGENDPALVAAMRQAIREWMHADRASPINAVFARTVEILERSYGLRADIMPSERTLYRLYRRILAEEEGSGA